MEREILFDYDEENDILFIHKKDKIKGSVDIADFIVDISTDEKVVGLEIMNATEHLEKLGIMNAKEVLKTIKNASLRAFYRQDGVVIYFSIVSEKTAEPVSSSIAMPIAVRA